LAQAFGLRSNGRGAILTQASRRPMDAIRATKALRRLAAESHCELLGKWGSFGWWIQGFLAFVSFASLVGKRFTDKVRRPWKVWFFDTSKQGLQCLMVHFLNIMLARGFDSWLGLDADPCNWYWINLSLDCTIGVLVMYLLLRSAQCAYRSKWVGRPELARSGDYGNPPVCGIFFRQLLDWLCMAVVQKLLLAIFVVIFGRQLSDISTWLLGWLDSYPKAKLVVVMVLTPLSLNVFALWTADSFLQAGECSEERHSLVCGSESSKKIVGERVSPSIASLSDDLDDIGDGVLSPGLMSYEQWKQRRKARDCVIGLARGP